MQTTQSAWVVQIFQRWIWHSGRLKTATNHPMSLMVWPIHTSLFSRTVSPALPRFQGSYSPHLPKMEPKQANSQKYSRTVCVHYSVLYWYTLLTQHCRLCPACGVHTLCACLKNVAESHTRLQSSIALLCFCIVMCTGLWATFVKMYHNYNINNRRKIWRPAESVIIRDLCRVLRYAASAYTGWAESSGAQTPDRYSVKS